MLVAGSVQLLGRTVELTEAPAPKLTRDYECSNAKLSSTARLHPEPLGRRGGRPTLLDEVDHDRLGVADRPAPLQHPLARAAQRGPAAAGAVRRGSVSGFERVLITGGGGQLASDLEELLRRRSALRARSHAELDITDDGGAARGRSPRLGRTSSSTAPPSTTSTSASARSSQPSRSTRRRSSGWRSSAPSTAPRLVHLSTNYVFDGSGRAPYGEDGPALAAEHLRAHQAGRRVRRAGLRAGRARGAHRPASTACTAAPPRAATSSRA